MKWPLFVHSYWNINIKSLFFHKRDNFFLINLPVDPVSQKMPAQGLHIRRCNMRGPEGVEAPFLFLDTQGWWSQFLRSFKKLKRPGFPWGLFRIHSGAINVSFIFRFYQTDILLIFWITVFLLLLFNYFVIYMLFNYILKFNILKKWKTNS